MLDPPLLKLLETERAYLRSRGWSQHPTLEELWLDPDCPTKSHIQRVAVDIQKKREGHDT